MRLQVQKAGRRERERGRGIDGGWGACVPGVRGVKNMRLVVGSNNKRRATSNLLVMGSYPLSVCFMH